MIKRQVTNFIPSDLREFLRTALNFHFTGYFFQWQNKDMFKVIICYVVGA